MSPKSRSGIEAVVQLIGPGLLLCRANYPNRFRRFAEMESMNDVLHFGLEKWISDHPDQRVTFSTLFDEIDGTRGLIAKFAPAFDDAFRRVAHVPSVRTNMTYDTGESR